MRAAVVGSGAAGLAAAHACAPAPRSPYSSPSRLRRPRPHGGRDAADAEGGRHARRRHRLPGLQPPDLPAPDALFGQLHVPTAATDMSFSVQVPDATAPGLEWAGSDLNARVRAARQPAAAALLAHAARPAALQPRWPRDRPRPQRRRAMRRVAAGLPRHASLRAPNSATGTCCRCCGCIWSLSRRAHARAFRPATFDPLLPQPRPAADRRPAPVAHGARAARAPTSRGSSRDCADVRLAHAGARIARATDAGVTSQPPAAGEASTRLVLACHSDQALALLADPTASERRAAGAVRYQPNRAVLHTDAVAAAARPARLGGLELPRRGRSAAAAASACTT